MNDAFLADYLSDPERLRGFQQAGLRIELAREVERAMKAQRISRKALAERMGVSKGRITQILSGTSNLTLRLVADAFTALGLRLELKPVPLSESRTGSPPALHPVSNAQAEQAPAASPDLKRQAS
jgi:transcriptional regulator with XRE-family HTH domain